MRPRTVVVALVVGTACMSPKFLEPPAAAPVNP